MSKQDKLFAVLLAVASGLIVWGVADWSVAVAKILGGGLLALLAWFVLTDQPATPAEPASDE